MYPVLRNPQLRQLGGPHEIERLSWPFWQKQMAEMDPEEHYNYHSQYPMSARLHCTVCRKMFEQQKAGDIQGQAGEVKGSDTCCGDSGVLGDNVHGLRHSGQMNARRARDASEQDSVDYESLLQQEMEEQHRRETQREAVQHQDGVEAHQTETDLDEIASQGGMGPHVPHFGDQNDGTTRRDRKMEF